jgi:hypothetical protein
MFGIPTPQTLAAKALIALVGVAIVAGAGAYAGYRFELGAYEKLVAADAKAMTVAVQAAAAKQTKIDSANQADAVAQAYLRGKLDAVSVNFKLEAPANVTVTQDQQAATAVHAGCITYGFVRMLTAGERGIPADSLPIPSGESPDACTAYEPSALATALAQDLAAGFGNGQQLDSLIAAVKRNDAIAAAPK